MELTKAGNVDISIITPILNGEKWIDACFNSIISQTILKHNINVEISIYNDGSTDNTSILLDKWKNIFTINNIMFTSNTNTADPKGVGFAKNESIKASSGNFLCFQDIDDTMLPNRLWIQFLAARTRLNCIIGSKFLREPKNSAARFTNWANNLTQHQYNIQIYTSHGPTVVMPTWFFHRSVFQRVGEFSEDGVGTAEDLIFFYKHLDNGGEIFCVDEVLLVYTYHLDSTTFSVTREHIWNIRLNQFIKDYIPKWKNGFTIWNAGKQGRLFIKSLNDEHKRLVKALCDVDINKIGKNYEIYCPMERRITYKFPIVHFSKAIPPLVICMKMDLTHGDFEANLQSLHLKEGIDYIMFS